ncbi:protein lifeguard 1-like [Calliphora vicina]|uniref:protein lifeguard 1-like n=1 Tax=Calliphora vicina TaxID=7373 RepID=UPI00325BF139
MRSVEFSPTQNEEEGEYAGQFEEDLIRRAFIQKVYFILSIQLVLTLGIISVFVFNEELQDYVTEQPHLLLAAFVITFVTMIALACCPNVRRKVPVNYMCLAIFTLAEGFLLGVISSIYDPMTVLIAVGITAAICFALTLFAMQTKWDFTVMGGFLLVVLVVFLLFGLLMFFFHSQVMKLIYCSLGVLIFSLYLLYDTQLMLGGKHQYALSPDEYVFAALNLYIDIVQIFMYILGLLGNRD